MDQGPGFLSVRWLLIPLAFGMLSIPAATAEAPRPLLHLQAGEVRIEVGGKTAARYVYEDARTPRPYFHDLHEPGGIQVTRPNPPLAGKDPTDHAELHPGLWLAFGDLNGSDFWRNKARVVHLGYAPTPSRPSGSAAFAVRNRYLSETGASQCLEETRTHVWSRAEGTLLVIDSVFSPEDGDLVFGDQEEMGLGVRVATPLMVTNGGRIRSSEGKENEKGIRGTNASWVDYSGVIGGRRVGVCLMPDPENFRPSWYHARDYGLLAANPFGRNALTGGEKSSVVVKKGNTLRLRFGVLLHGGKDEAGVNLPAAYADYLQLLRLLPRK